AALVPIAAIERGALRIVRGRAVAANLPAHIAQRMASRASSLLSRSGLAADIAAERVRAASPGAGLFLCAEYERTRAGFSALGAPGKLSETVAEEVVADVVAFHRSGAAVDSHLADQLIVPAALAAGESRLCAARATGHLATSAWLVELFGLARVRVAKSEDGVALVSVLPFGHRVG
ncbi:MAG: RNA 3'-terminal phosphate cyclase, partial [Alphaproteobacteria bacterium]